MEVYVDVSEEAAAAQAAAAAAAALARAEELRLARAAAEALEAAAAAERASAAGAARRRAEAEAALQRQAGAIGGGTRVALRLPSGERFEASFVGGRPGSLSALFAWADSLPGVLGGAVEGSEGDYALALAYPRRTLLRPAAGAGEGSLCEAGLPETGAVMLNLEALALT